MNETNVNEFQGGRCYTFKINKSPFFWTNRNCHDMNKFKHGKRNIYIYLYLKV